MFWIQPRPFYEEMNVTFDLSMPHLLYISECSTIIQDASVMVEDVLEDGMGENTWGSLPGTIL